MLHQLYGPSPAVTITHGSFGGLDMRVAICVVGLLMGSSGVLSQEAQQSSREKWWSSYVGATVGLGRSSAGFLSGHEVHANGLDEVFAAAGSGDGQIGALAEIIAGSDIRVGQFLLLGLRLGAGRTNLQHKLSVDQSIVSTQVTATRAVKEARGSFTYTLPYEADWELFAHLRVGVQITDNVLLYGLFGGSRVFLDGLLASVQHGLSYGGGVELRLSDRWALQTEYRQLDLGSIKAQVPNPFQNGSAPDAVRVDLSSSTLRFGLTYSWD